MKVRLWQWLLVLLAAAGAPHHVPVAAPGNPSAWDLVHPDRFDGADREQRRELAADLLHRVRLLAVAVPPQNPDEAARVREQRAELESLGEEVSARNRARLYLSRPYQHRQALDILGGARTALECARDSETLALEMTCWARATAYLLQEDELNLALGVLRDRRMIPRDRDMPVKAQDPVIWYGEYGRGILNLVLIPYLELLAEEGSP